jgi:FecR protein
MTTVARARIFARGGIALLLLLVLTPSAGWSEEVGTIAALQGTVDIGRGGAWSAAQIGTPVDLNDQIRTGKPGRARVLFRDQSVINIGDESLLRIDEQVFDPAGASQSVFELLRGKVRTLVSEYYKEPQARFEVHTGTSVAGVRGTEFVVVYDDANHVSEVVGVSGEVAVRSVLIPIGKTVFIHAREITTVHRGGYPSSAQPLDDVQFRQYLQGLEFIGGGAAESLAFGNPVAGGAVIPPDDRAEPIIAGIGGPSGNQPISILGGPLGSVPGDDRYTTPDVSNLVGDPPSSVAPPTHGDVGVPF